MTEYYKALAMALGHAGNAMITAIIAGAIGLWGCWASRNLGRTI